MAGAFIVLDGSSPSGQPGGTEPEPQGAWLAASCDLPPDILERIERGTVPGRSPDVHMVPREPNFFGSFKVTTHSGPWDYLQEVPLVFYGPGYIEPNGSLTVDREVTLADVAPTLAELIDFSMPSDRPGRSIADLLTPASPASEPPRLVVLVVWDGAGWNVLDEWPKAWSFLRSLMDEGVSIEDVTVGSSPSVTPATHSTMGTGAFPVDHGIPDIPLRNGKRVPDSFPNKSPKFLELETLADLYDLDRRNEPLVGTIAERGWHLGMMGHGAFLSGADRDFAVLWQGGEGSLTTNSQYYRLPRYLHEVPGLARARATVDAADGSRDGAWMGHPLPDIHRAGAANPVWTRYQTRLIEALMEREGFGRDQIPDLFFTNVKEIDLVGHVYNLVKREMRSQLHHADIALQEFVSFLDDHVGAGRWVMALTADHGSGPAPRSVGAWPIDMDELRIDIALRFRISITRLFQAQRPTGLWLRPQVLERRGISLEEVADFLLEYSLADNVSSRREIPRAYADRRNEKLFAAAFPTARLDEVVACAQESA